MHRRALVSVVLVSLLGLAHANDPLPGALFGVLAGGGTIYCKASYDSGLPDPARVLCYGEYNVFELGALRLNVATRFDIRPVSRVVPLVLIDYTEEYWFGGLEFGPVIGERSGWFVGVSFGGRLPAMRDRP
jgi:hypothetical protein